MKIQDWLQNSPHGFSFVETYDNWTIVKPLKVQFKERLRRVLWAFANYNKDVGYCQGLNRIACLALEHLSEEVSFNFSMESKN